MRTLVVGASGFIGQHVLSVLDAKGHEIVAVDMNPQPAAAQFADWLIGSCADEALISAAATGCDSLIYLASNSVPASANSNMAAEIESHVRIAVSVFENCQAQVVNKIIFASSGGTIYGEAKERVIHESHSAKPINAYGVSKLAIEGYLSILSRSKDVNAVSLRIANPYGVGQRAMRGQGFVAAAMECLMRDKILPIWGDGGAVRDFIYVTDVADAFEKALHYTGPHIALNIGSGEGCTLQQMAEAITRYSGSELKVRYERQRSVDVKSNVLDISGASKVLAWAPTIGLQDGLTKTHAWWRSLA